VWSGNQGRMIPTQHPSKRVAGDGLDLFVRPTPLVEQGEEAGHRTTRGPPSSPPLVQRSRGGRIWPPMTHQTYLAGGAGEANMAGKGSDLGRR
jgi:hypothetical protein